MDIYQYLFDTNENLRRRQLDECSAFNALISAIRLLDHGNEYGSYRLCVGMVRGSVRTFIVALDGWVESRPRVRESKEVASCTSLRSFDH
jgi:hypothetical protein